MLGAAVWLALGAPAETVADATVNVPIDHWSYRFIERCETKGLIHGLGDGIKPFSRREMALVLARIDSSAAASVDVLTTIEGRELDLLKAEFVRELAALAGKRRGGSREPGGIHGPGSGAGVTGRARSAQPVFGYEFDEGFVEADLLMRQQTNLMSGRTRDSNERVYRNRFGGVARGLVGENIGFRISFEQTREQGNRDYVLREDVFERRLEIPQLKDNRVDYHQGNAYVVLSLPFVDVELGKDEARWGPAPGDNLGLSNNASSYDMLRLRAQYGVFKLVSIAGSLRPCPDRPDSPVCGGVGDTADTYIVNGLTRPLDREKYLAAHRLEIELAESIDIGFHEVLVYGDRGPSFTYLNPIMFYWAAQSYQGDKDNLMIGVDVDIHPGHGLRFYAAYVADDLKKLRIFSNDFANKFSLQAGVLLADPLGIDDLDLRAEYVRIEPWIYTHKFPINTFRHFDAPLGHSLGPNADRWTAEIGKRLTRDFAVKLDVGHTRQGSNVLLENGGILNVGGDLHRGWRPGDDRENKEFLAGNLHRWTRVGASLSYRVWPRLNLAAGYGVEWGENVPLPPRDGSAMPLQSRAGYGDGREGQFHFDLRYGYL